MTRSSLRICLGIILLVEFQSPIWVGASNNESSSSPKSPLTSFRRASQDPPPGQVSASPQDPPPAAVSAPQQETAFVLIVRDENGAPVTSAKVYLYGEGSRPVATWETDFAGRVTMTGVAPGLYH